MGLTSWNVAKRRWAITKQTIFEGPFLRSKQDKSNGTKKEDRLRLGSEEAGGQKEFQVSPWGTHRFRDMVWDRRCSLLRCNRIPQHLLATPPGNKAGLLTASHWPSPTILLEMPVRLVARTTILPLLVTLPWENLFHISSCNHPKWTKCRLDQQARPQLSWPAHLRGAREGASEQAQTGPKKPKIESQGWESRSVVWGFLNTLFYIGQVDKHQCGDHYSKCNSPFKTELQIHTVIQYAENKSRKFHEFSFQMGSTPLSSLHTICYLL